MSQSTITYPTEANSSVIFGIQLGQDPYNIIRQVDNDTVVVTPKMNTSGLTELKVCNVAKRTVRLFSIGVLSHTRYYCIGWCSVAIQSNRRSFHCGNCLGVKNNIIRRIVVRAWSTDHLTLCRGASAIRMAINDINAKGVIPGAYITLIQKDSFPVRSVNQDAVTDAVYASVTLLQQGVIGVIGDISSSWTSLSALMTSTLEIPQCSFTATAGTFYLVLCV